MIKLGVGKTQYYGRKVSGYAPLSGVLSLDGVGSRSEIWIGDEAWNLPLDTQFTVCKMKMDDVHMWAKFGTGFKAGSTWIRVEWARPPRPPGNYVKTMNVPGINWYIAPAVPQTEGRYLIHSKATTLQTPITLK